MTIRAGTETDSGQTLYTVIAVWINLRGFRPEKYKAV